MSANALSAVAIIMDLRAGCESRNRRIGFDTEAFRKLPRNSIVGLRA
jgi:hypothetical protein